MILLLSLFGCNDNEIKTQAGAEAENKTEASSVKEEQEEQEEQEDTAESENDLSGKLLLDSIEFKVLDSVVMVSEMIGFDGNSVESKMFKKGENTRTEMESLGMGLQIMIYNAELGATYQYVEGQTSGIVLYDDAEDMMSEMDMSTPTFVDLVDGSGDDITARMDSLNGEEVIYIETTESDEDMGDADVFMWYSTKYCVPLKYEMYINGNLVVSSTVTHISEESIDSSLFEPPSNIEFSNYSMDDLFNTDDE